MKPVPKPAAVAAPADSLLLQTEGANCSRCGGKIEPRTPAAEKQGALVCLTCAGLAELIFVPSGNAALTRRATKLSRQSLVVVEYNRRRKRWERRGTLVEEQALADAEAECLIDEDRRNAAREKARARDAVREQEYLARFAAEIREEFPGLAPETAAQIAAHACEKHSGRVGRTAGAKELDRDLIVRAVVAHARHLHTEYDSLRDAGLNKRDSRDIISSRIREILDGWRRPLAGAELE